MWWLNILTETSRAETRGARTLARTPQRAHGLTLLKSKNLFLFPVAHSHALGPTHLPNPGPARRSGSTKTNQSRCHFWQGVEQRHVENKWIMCPGCFFLCCQMHVTYEHTCPFNKRLSACLLLSLCTMNSMERFSFTSCLMVLCCLCPKMTLLPFSVL